jgi:hypothetical protein
LTSLIRSSSLDFPKSRFGAVFLGAIRNHRVATGAALKARVT